MMVDTLHTRRMNLRTLVHQWGGPTSLAKKLRLSGPSYVSQLLSGSRPITEKTARKFEGQLGLAAGWLDADHDGHQGSQTLDTTMITRVITLVATLVSERSVTVSPGQMAEITSIVYDDAVARGRLDDALAGRIVGLLKM
jgi:hypothetical protein